MTGSFASPAELPPVAQLAAALALLIDGGALALATALRPSRRGREATESQTYDEAA